MHAELFEKNFGGHKAYFHAGSPWLLAPQNAAQIRGRTRVRIGAGALDDLYERNLTYHEMLFYEKLGASAFRFYQQAPLR